MNVQRFTGKDNRSALDQVRQALGPDALVLSSRRTAAGIEICATQSLPDMGSTPVAVAGVTGADNEIQLAQLKRELKSLRETLQQALGERRWQDTAASRPVSASVAQRLATLGIGRVLAGELADEAANQSSLEAAWQEVTQALLARLQTLSAAELEGFRIKAVIGGSGSGKTSTAVALVHTALQQHSADRLAVIHCGDPTEKTRLTDLAERLGIRQFGVQNHSELAEALGACRWAREVIIDTPALSPARGSQDPVLAMLMRQRGGLAGIVTLPANASADHLREIVDHSACLNIAGLVTTKVDETNSLGAIIDVTVYSNLALAGRYDRRNNAVEAVSANEMLANAKRLAKRSMERKAAHLKVAV